MTARSPKAGFSLIEVLVALAVFAIAAIALLNAASTGVRASALLEDRALALVVAENLAVEATLDPARFDLGLIEGEETMAGRAWRWRRVVAETENARFREITIGVARADETQELATLVIFRRTR